MFVFLGAHFKDSSTFSHLLGENFQIARRLNPRLKPSVFLNGLREEEHVEGMYLLRSEYWCLEKDGYNLKVLLAPAFRGIY